MAIKGYVTYKHFKQMVSLIQSIEQVGITKKIADEFIHGVMGMGGHQESMYQEGLIDSARVSELDENFPDLKVIGMREKPLSGVSAPWSFQYFKECKAEVIHYNMLKSVWEAAGLVSPPAIFTTNTSESEQSYQTAPSLQAITVAWL